MCSRVIGIITDSSFKIQEAKDSFQLYGIDVVKLNKNTTPTDIQMYLSSSSSSVIPVEKKDEKETETNYRKPSKMICILREQTTLLTRDRMNPATMNHLELVSHQSTLNMYRLSTVNLETYVLVKTHTSYVDGFLDWNLRGEQEKEQGKPNQERKGIYDWDDIFVVEQSFQSYVQAQTENKKVSARSVNLDHVCNELLHYKTLGDLHHHPQRYTQPVDFRRHVSDYCDSIPEFQSTQFQASGLNNILTVAINQGVFFRSPETRREKIYWCPGLNAGIPLTSKPKDPMHELTFQFHDFSHFNIPDLVFDGNPTGIDDKCYRQVYIVYRLISECITLVLADMIFVNNVLCSGHDYETKDQRKIYPVFQAMLAKWRHTLSKHMSWSNFVHEVLVGSFEYCFFHDTSRWESMMDINKDTNDDVLNREADPEKNTMGTKEDTKTHVLEPFKHKYDRYFMEDFRWTRTNFDNMMKTPDVYKEWFSHVSKWISCGVGIELESITSFIVDNHLIHSYVSKQPKYFFHDIFDIVYDKYVKRLFAPPLSFLDSNKDDCKGKNVSGVLVMDETVSVVTVADATTKRIPRVSHTTCILNRFVRYMMGQSILFFQHGKIPFAGEYFKRLSTLIERCGKTYRDNERQEKDKDKTEELLSQIDTARAFYNAFLTRLKECMIISPDDAKNFQEICPIFPPCYVDYDHVVGTEDKTLKEFVDEVLQSTEEQEKNK